ncbi:putative 60s ribosomal subunit biogenesis protein nop16 protein [Neofusicoccum parvum UCRNP2]|uniref:Nucleolar protein 16 n=1 Tax=Botryosphaeria parva (strain UCR-NP2) TaxID=1287680 RepID=R1GN82_BOTPV|nr:putative 60s ribosomal subunit biogenesis protein nop16 protein [Neofusicoccum parvum UCRNP2]
MGRELQKRKNRSSISKVRKKPKSKKKVLNNPIIAANWNKNETLTQNYRRLGLATKLNATTGGVEKTAKSVETPNNITAPLSVASKLAMVQVKTSEARIERDPETGAVRIVEDGSKRPNPLNDPLNELDEEEAEWQGITAHDVPAVDPAAAEKSDNPVVRQLEELAASAGKRKAPRKQSEREVEWVERLVKKYGDDYGKMSRDMKLNPMQQSEGDIKRRVKKWRESQQE